MKVIASTTYGSANVFQLTERTKPSPLPHQVIIRNYATTVTAADIMMRKGEPKIGRLYLGLRKPKRTVLGFDFAGEIIEIGNQVTSFKVGDKVFGGTTKLGCYAEYVCVDAHDVITTLPHNLSYTEAAPVSSSGITVWNFLMAQVNLQPNQKILINGASGSLGTYAIQIAKAVGAHVTGVCSGANMEWVKNLGADEVIDYTQVDFTRLGNTYDVIFDAVGKRNFTDCKRALTPRGVYISSVMDGKLFMQMIFTSIFSRKKAKTSATGMLPVKKRLAYLVELKQWMQTGKIKTVIDQTYPMSLMTTAHEYVEKGHKKGNMVISLQ
jgi:NADPH:quinone reductase-like Zn-dependent oxidoreductase